MDELEKQLSEEHVSEESVKSSNQHKGHLHILLKLDWRNEMRHRLNF